MTVAHLKEGMDQRFKAVDRRFSAVDKRFDAIDKRFSAVDRRFDAIDKRFEVVDARFDRLTARMDAGFASMHDKLNAILQALKNEDDHQQKILDEHEERLNDLEVWRRASQGSAG